MKTPKPPKPKSPQSSASASSASAADDLEQHVEDAPPKEPTVPASIRLWQSAYDALKVLMAKYGKSMVDMVSTAILAYARNAVAAPILRLRLLDVPQLYTLQAAATDIRIGLSNLREDLYRARKSTTNPATLTSLYNTITARYKVTLSKAEETLDLLAKESVLIELIKMHPELLPEIIKELENRKPTSQKEKQMIELQLRILRTILPATP